MEHEYQRGKKHIFFMVLFILFAWGICLLLLGRDAIGPNKLDLPTRIMMIGTAVPMTLALFNIKKQSQQKVSISSERIKCRQPNDAVIIRYDKIIKIKYLGVRWFPLFDQLSIHSGDEVIYIDSTYTEYREMWLEILKNLKAIRPHFKIDRRILRRLKVDENLQPIDA